ncbi:CopG family transcriptional regulator [Nocardioides sp. AE5]|uniref:ribbon-helix-helix domain-containing protein n=1 Tax=Nocardioides sp. AE5 TaxID=2962573 RepID=UPI002882AF8B|nr:CopG family transcriptional regulator [Nocardioides sp. AE5]MDT0203497.1 CopG family transcriptional regulator [Nocardioides sp. AE5]
MYDYIMLRTQISLTEEDRSLLDAESARTGRSISALIRDAVARTYGFQTDKEADLQAIDAALGAWHDREVDGAEYVESLRSGGRLAEMRNQ